MPPSISAIIPAYNEGRQVAEVVTAARAFLPVLVVDDGSTDRTASLAKEAGATVIQQTPNQGKGAALRAGFRWALDQEAEAVVTLDADGQHDPTEIPGFLEAWSASRPDLVVGARDFSEMPLVRQLANTIGRLTFSWAIGRPIPDNQSGYRLLSSRMMAAMLKASEGGFEFEVEMIVECLSRGYALTWIPIRTIYAGEASHIRPWHHTWNYFRMVWKTRQKFK